VVRGRGGVIGRERGGSGEGGGGCGKGERRVLEKGGGECGKGEEGWSGSVRGHRRAPHGTAHEVLNVRDLMQDRMCYYLVSRLVSEVSNALQHGAHGEEEALSTQPWEDCKLRQ